MTDELDDRLRDLGARWREHAKEETPGSRRRHDLTWIAAAVVVAMALGATLWLTRGLGDGEADPAPSPEVGVVPWKALDPTWPALDPETVAAYDAIEVAADLDIEAEAGSPAAYQVTLTSPERVTLDPCPDYSLNIQNEWDDFTGDAHALNCAAIPFQDKEGTPYLPAGEPVTFAMSTGAALSSAPVSWSLITGGSPDRVTGAITVPEEDRASLPRFCATVRFEGRSYQIAAIQPGTGVGRPLGEAAGRGCGSDGALPLEVYSANEQPASEAITASFQTGVVVYVPSAGPADEPPPFPDTLTKENETVRDSDLELVRRFAAFAVRPDLDSFTAVGWTPDGVRIGLGPTLTRVTGTDPARVGTWTFDLNGFAAAVGPINVLDVLREHLLETATDSPDQPRADLMVGGGDHRRCAGPPGDDPAGTVGLRHIAILPADGDIDSCLQWFALDLYLDDVGRIAAVSLDLWEP